MAALLILPAGNRFSEMQIRQMQSANQLKGIAKRILAYKMQHGGVAPKRMSEIVPDDRIDLLSMFYAPNRPPTRRPDGWLTNKADLDEFSDYAMSSNSDNDILAFEKPSVWADQTVAVCSTNLTVKRMSVAAFKKLFP